MNILITGISGFIGKNLIDMIIKDKHEHNLILLTSRDIDGFVTIRHQNYNFTTNDFINKNIKEIDTIIHLGAFTPKTSASINDIDNSNKNIYNTEHLLNNLPTIPKNFIYISTLDVYQQNNEVITESTPTIPSSLYGHSKLYCEKMLEKWSEKNNVILQILRLGHVYGRGEEQYQKIIPQCIRAVTNNEQPLLFSDGIEKRSFIHVNDVCRFILKSMYLTKYEGAINLVSGNTICIKDLVDFIINLSGKEIKPKKIKTAQLPRNIFFDNNKMESILGKEEIALFDGLEDEYNYFLKQLHVGEYIEKP